MLRHRDVDRSFFTTAPHTTTVRQQLPATPARVWEVLEDPHAWTVWLGLERVTWTSELGPGATRTICNGPMNIDEEFFVWEPHEVMAFRFVRSLLPVKALAEEYVLRDNGDGTTDLAWTFAVHGIISPVGALVLHQLRGLAERSAPKLAEYLA